MPRFVVVQGLGRRKTVEFGDGTTFVGRSRKNDVVLFDQSVSSRHLKVFQIGRKYFVEDLSSTNGTRVNGQRLEPGEGFEVEEGDLIQLGRIIFRIQDLPAKTAIENAFTSVNKEVRTLPPEKNVDTDRRSPSNHGIQLIQNVSGLLKQSFNFQSFCRKVLEYILNSLPRVDMAALAYLDPYNKINEKEKVKNRALNKTLMFYSRPEIKNSWKTLVMEKIIDRVLESRKTVRVLNAACEYSDDHAGPSRFQIQSALCIPLISNSVIQGALYIHSTRNPRGFRKEDIITLNTLSPSLAIAFEKTSLLRDRENRSLR